MRKRTLAFIAAPPAALVLAALLVLPFLGVCAAPKIAGLHPDRIRLPEGFTFGVFAEDLPGARSLVLADDGWVFVGTRDAGNVYAVRDRDGDGRAEEIRTVLRDLETPNGVAWRNGALYVAEISRVLRYDDLLARLDDPPAPAIVRDDLPDEDRHGWKFIAFGPDDYLYVPIGAPGNNVLSEDERFASICRMRPDGSDFSVFAHGVRNTVGFDWRPETGEMWFTDNGRDWMGDDRPPDELNRAPRPGLHFGYPFRHGRELVDPDYGEDAPPDRTFVPPEIELGPHVAALGMRFYDGTMFPEEYRGSVFIAEHGSWNRREPIGYRVMRVPISADGRATGYLPFAEGWLEEDGTWGRPVDVLVMPDGALLVSDDQSGAIYRIAWDADR